MMIYQICKPNDSVKEYKVNSPEKDALEKGYGIAIENTTCELIAVTPEGVKVYRINSQGKTIVPIMLAVDRQGKCTTIR